MRLVIIAFVASFLQECRKTRRIVASLLQFAEEVIVSRVPIERQYGDLASVVFCSD